MTLSAQTVARRPFLLIAGSLLSVYLSGFTFGFVSSILF